MQAKPKSQIVFDNEPEKVNESLSKRQDFSEMASFESDPAPAEQLLEQAIVPKGRTNLWLKFGLTGAFIMALWELGQWLISGFDSSPVSAVIYSVISVLLLIAVFGSLLRELGKLSRLKKTQKLRHQGEGLLDSGDNEQGVLYCKQLAAAAGVKETQEYKNWLAQLSDAHNDREVLTLYSRLVLASLDVKAKKEVAKWSGEAALLVAISPLAVMDMLIILWRNTKMVESVAGIYGLELGYLSRLSLFKMVLFNMIYAAGAEVLADVGADMLGAELTGKISAKVAQGIGAGLLTARLGFKSMELCRPMPWLEDERPKSSHIRHLLLKKIKTALAAR